MQQRIRAGTFRPGDRPGDTDADLRLAGLPGAGAERRPGAHPVRRALPRFLAAGEGATALELALVFPLFMVLVLAVFWVALLLWTENSIRFAADAAARCASVDGTSCGTITAIQDAAIAWSNGVPIARANVTVNLGITCTPGVTGNAVAIRYTVTYFLFSSNTAAEACYPSIS